MKNHLLFAALASTSILGALAFAGCGGGNIGETHGSGGAANGGGGAATTEPIGGSTGDGGSSTSDGGGGGAANTGGGTASGGGGGAPPSSVPTDPIQYPKEKPFTVEVDGAPNYVFVPKGYDDSHQTPTTLFLWLHGCGGRADGDIWVVSPGDQQSWISLAIGGAEGDCWDVDHGPARVLDSLADIKTHFNIAPKKVVMGGYSSGGDLGYRTAFYNAGLFAGLLAENTSPFRDTGSSQAMSLAAASWKFNIVHLAHLQDTTYSIGGVRTETEAVKAAGFPLTRIEKDGGHYDDAGAMENGHAVPGTDADLVDILLPYLDEGWTAP